MRPSREATSSSGRGSRQRGRHENAADDRGVDQDPAAERGREDLGLGARLALKRDEGEAEDQRRARDEASGAADALDDRRSASNRCGRRPRASG